MFFLNFLHQHTANNNGDAWKLKDDDVDGAKMARSNTLL